MSDSLNTISNVLASAFILQLVVPGNLGPFVALVLSLVGYVGLGAMKEQAKKEDVKPVKNP